MAETLALVFHPEEELEPPAWADRYRTLVGGDMPGLWRTSMVPYWRALMAACGRPDVRVVTLMKPAQCGATEAIFNVLMWSMDQRPGRWMVMYPNAPKAETVSQTRFVPQLRQCEKAFRHVGNEKRNLKAARTDFDRGTIEWIGSNSDSNTEGTPARFIWIDEFDRCDETARSKLLERGKTFSDSKVIETGTPGDAGKGIDARRGAATCQNVWYVPCPHCRNYHTRNWRQVRWANRGDADPPIVRRTAWYECPACTEKCTASDRAWQGRLGVWLAQGQTVSEVRKDEHERDIPGEVFGECPPVDHTSFAILGIDNDLLPNPYGEVAAAFLEKIRAHGQVDYVWCTETLGEAYVVKGARIEVSELEARCKNSVTAKGHCPLGTVGVVVVCDVQVDRLYWGAFAFSNRGEHIWLSDWGCEPCLGDGTLHEVLDALRLKEWPIHKAGEKPRIIKPSIIAVDTGHRAEVLYRYRKDRDAKTVLVKGFATKGNRDTRPYTRSMIEYAGSKIPLYRVNVTIWKNSMARFLSGVTDGHSEILATLTDGSDAGLRQTWHLPKDADRDMLAQLCSEQYVDGIWAVRRKGDANHYWDIFIYAAAVLEALGVREVNTGVSNGKVQGNSSGGGNKPSGGVEPAARVGQRGPVGQRFLD